MNKQTIILILILLLISSFISGCTQLQEQSKENMPPNNENIPPRYYPTYIKGVWEPIPYPNQYEMIKNDLNQLKDDGVNTIYILPIYPEDSAPPEYTEKTIIWEIKKVRQEGFAVFICTDIFVENLNLNNIDDFLNSLKQFILKWAEIAEDYNVEYFAPANELYMVVREKLGYEENSTQAEQLWRKIDGWHQEIISAIKEVYTGKMCYKPASIGFNDDPSTITLTGYDVFAPNMPVGGFSLDEFKGWLDIFIPLIINVSQTYNVEWMVGEYWIQADTSLSFCQAGLDKIEKATVPPIGFAFGGWTCKDGPVKNTVFEEVIKNWWSKK